MIGRAKSVPFQEENNTDISSMKALTCFYWMMSNPQANMVDYTITYDDLWIFKVINAKSQQEAQQKIKEWCTANLSDYNKKIVTNNARVYCCWNTLLDSNKWIRGQSVEKLWNEHVGGTIVGVAGANIKLHKVVLEGSYTEPVENKYNYEPSDSQIDTTNSFFTPVEPVSGVYLNTPLSEMIKQMTPEMMLI